MSAVSLIAVGVAANKTAPYSLTSITGTVYDSGGTSYTIPTPKSLVFFRGKTFIPPNNPIVFQSTGNKTYNGSSTTTDTQNLINANSVPIWINIYGHSGLIILINYMPVAMISEHVSGNNYNSVSIYISNPSGVTTISFQDNYDNNTYYCTIGTSSIFSRQIIYN